MAKKDELQNLETIQQDDFYNACIEAGIKVEESEEFPDGIGAIWVPRLKAPSTTDKNWIHYTAGGYNYCIKIYGNSCLPNCVGYAWGRWRELLGKKHNLSCSDAERWYGKNDGYKRGTTPKLGAVICWRKGRADTDADGMGHVAIVEKINADGSITCSNSAYYSTRFWLSTHKPPYHFSGYTFQGFIYNPINYDVNPGKLDVDGEFGVLSVKATQKWLGTVQDGIISDQNKSIKTYAPAILSYDLDGGGSAMIRTFQNYLKKNGYAITVNGYVDKQTVIAWQKWLNRQGYPIKVDGYFGEESAMAMQKFLNRVL